jgi:ribulose-5-phosphate 4-epimerase/fuculose-1-phosphate aldolase
LQDKRSILLANHGLITAGTSIEEATYLAVYFERAAALQLAASAAGTIKIVRSVQGDLSGRIDVRFGRIPSATLQNMHSPGSLEHDTTPRSIEAVTV